MEAQRLGNRIARHSWRLCFPNVIRFCVGSAMSGQIAVRQIRTTAIHRSRSDVLDRLHAVEDYLSSGQIAFTVRRNQSRCGEDIDSGCEAIGKGRAG